MILIFVIGMLFLGVVFFHYLQGLFSSTISAILAIISAALAFSWHESVVEMLNGNMANVSNAVVLVGLFAVIYTILRVIFDKLVPAGVTLPVIIDRVGGAVMGCIAATFCVGTLVVAAEELPFGNNIAGYTKYDAQDNNVMVMSGGAGQNQNGFNYNELHSNNAGKFLDEERRQMFPIIPAGIDEMVMNTISHLSEIGSLQGDQKLSAVHPDFLQELYGQSIGIQTGAKHVAYNKPGIDPAIKVESIYTVSRVFARDAEEPSVRGSSRIIDGLVADGEYRSAPAGSMLLVVRISFDKDATDQDSIFRFSPGSIRLVAGSGGKPKDVAPHNYYPIGTLEHTPDGIPVLYEDKPDDFLLAMLGKSGRTGIDLVFALDKSSIISGNEKTKIAPGVFIEVKRLVREDLGGKPIAKYAPPPTGGMTIGTLHPKFKQPLPTLKATTSPAKP